MKFSGEFTPRVRGQESIKKSIIFSGFTIGEFLSENVSKPLDARVFIGE